MYKKALLLMLACSLIAVMILSGCTGTKPTDGDPGTPTNKPADPTEKPTEQPTTEAPVEKASITYVSWGLGAQDADTLERRMIKEFNASQEEVEVVIDEAMDYSAYEQSLTASAAAGKLPDVFMFAHIPTGLVNDWLLDITPYTKDDPAWATIPKPVEEVTHYGKGIYAVPVSLFMAGYYVNDDLFQQYNENPLDFEPTFDDFLASVKNMTKPTDGIFGLGEEVQIPEWYPAAANPKYSFYAWDPVTQTFNIDSREFIQGINIAKELFQGKYFYDALPEEERAAFNVGWFGELWDQGKTAVRWDATWALGNFSQLPFNARFIGIPGGRSVLIGDYYVLSNASEHPEAAYKFARYMSFDKDGIKKRMELAKENPAAYAFNSLPISTDPEVIDEYFKVVTFPGVKEAFEAIDNDIMEGFKYIPGYVDARWNGVTGITVGDKENATIGDVIWNSFRGSVKYEDYAKQLNELANQKYKDVSAQIKALTD